MMRGDKYLLAMAQNSSLNWKELREILLIEKWEDLWQRPRDFLNKGISQKIIEKIIESKRYYIPDQIFDLYQRKNIYYSLATDVDYPPLLKETPDYPAILYYKGSLDVLDKMNLAVVGSRMLSPYGQKACQNLLPGVIERVNIISGLAIGCDTLAHKLALKFSGKTFAVLGSGLDIIYPRENVALAQEIVQNGALISEFPLGARPAKHHFPMRNRIIAGVSQATLVIEAAEKSGSLITARLALEYNREVLTVPGGMFNTNSVGTNNLIKVGAVPVTSSQEILDNLH